MHLAPYTHFQLDQVLALYQSVGWTNYLDRADSLEAALINPPSLFSQPMIKTRWLALSVW